MRWLGRLLRADMGVRISSAEFVLRDTGVTSLALQRVSSAARLWLLRASLEWLKVGIEGHVFLVNSAHFLYRYTELACLTFCIVGVATNWSRSRTLRNGRVYPAELTLCIVGIATNWRLFDRTLRNGRVCPAELLHRYTLLACLTLCSVGIATILRFWKCNGPCRSC